MAEEKEPEQEKPPVDLAGDELYQNYEGSPEEEEKPAETPVEPTPTEDTKAKEPEEPKHSTDSLKRAFEYGLSSEDIDDMTPAQLERVMARMNSFGQTVWNAAKPKEEPKKEEAEASVWDEAYEKSLQPEYVQPIKKKFAALEKELKSERSAREEIAKELREAKIERIHERIDGLVEKMGPEATKSFDRTTSKGKAAFDELMATMGGLSNAAKSLGKDLPERELLERAARAMGVSTKAEPKEDPLAAKKKEWEEGAVAKPGGRKKAMSAVDAVGAILSKRNGYTPPKEEQTQWEDD